MGGGESKHGIIMVVLLGCLVIAVGCNYGIMKRSEIAKEVNRKIEGEDQKTFWDLVMQDCVLF